MASDFDQRVAALRGKVPAKSSKKKKADCTPEEYAAKLNYLSAYKSEYKASNPERVREWTKRGNRKWRESNAERLSEIKKGWAQANPEKVREQKRRHYAAHAEAIKQKAREWASANPEKVRDKNRTYSEGRLKSDPDYKMRSNLRSRLNRAIRGGYKKGSAVRDLGCTIEEFWTHMESLFQPGMTRENMGTAWEIDHIYPLSKADLTGSRTEFLAANNWRNLQPLTPEENAAKGDKVTIESQFLFDSLCLEFSGQVAA